MNYLLDTNIVSEWAKPHPNSGVLSWLDEVDEDGVLISVVTLAELSYGIERLSAGRRRTHLEAWLREELPERFEGRVLPISSVIAQIWGKIIAAREAAGLPIGAMDAFLAATARIHGLTIVTRNVSDFEPSMKGILNPWSEG